jgi:chromosome segregation ATPase
MKPTRRKLVLEKIARKNMVETAKLRNAIGEQEEKLNEINELMTRIKELQENSGDKFCVSPNELRAARWYSIKLSEQCMILENRIEFVETELAHLRKSSRDKSYRNSKLEKLINEAKQMVRLEKDRVQEKKTTFVKSFGTT